MDVINIDNQGGAEEVAEICSPEVILQGALNTLINGTFCNRESAVTHMVETLLFVINSCEYLMVREEGVKDLVDKVVIMLGGLKKLVVKLEDGSTIDIIDDIIGRLRMVFTCEDIVVELTRVVENLSVLNDQEKIIEKIIQCLSWVLVIGKEAHILDVSDTVNKIVTIIRAGQGIFQNRTIAEGAIGGLHILERHPESVGNAVDAALAVVFTPKSYFRRILLTLECSTSDYEETVRHVVLTLLSEISWGWSLGLLTDVNAFLNGVIEEIKALSLEGNKNPLIVTFENGESSNISDMVIEYLTNGYIK